MNIVAAIFVLNYATVSRYDTVKNYTLLYTMACGNNRNMGLSEVANAQN